MFGISPDTLRYFDKQNIIPSQKEAGNNYRYYEDWDINFLIEYKKYRSFQFSVSETTDILYNDSLAELVEKFEHKGAEIEEQLKLLTKLNEKVREYTESLKAIKAKVGSFSFTRLDDTYYYEIRFNNDYMYEEDNIKDSNTWMENFPFTEPALIIEDIGSKSYTCGFAVDKSVLERIQMEMNPQVKKAGAGTYLNTVIVAGERNTFTTDLLQPALDYIADIGYVVSGTIIGYYLARVHELEAYRRYIEINIPIVNKDGD